MKQISLTSCVKKMYAVLFFICFFYLANGQNKGSIIYTARYAQTEDKIKIVMMNGVIESVIYGGQPYGAKVTNLTKEVLDVSFDIIVTTVCGKEVRGGGFNHQYIDPLGTETHFSVVWNQIITKFDCANGESTSYISTNSKIVNGINRIKSIRIENLVVKIVPKQNNEHKTVAVKANSIGSRHTDQKKQNVELTDDEKLNKAMMKKLEKDFDDEQKANKVERVVSSSKKNNTTEFEIKSESKSKDVQKVKEYKNHIVTIINNHFCESKSIDGVLKGETHINNYTFCHWDADVFIFTLEQTKNGVTDFKAIKKIDIKKCGNISYDGDDGSMYNSNGNGKTIHLLDRFIWTLRFSGNYDGWISSENKELIETLKTDFQYLKDHQSN
jgi:hypothetical protein